MRKVLWKAVGFQILSLLLFLFCVGLFTGEVFADEVFAEVIKFKNASFKEVLDYLSQRYGFSYVIQYPDFSFAKNEGIKEITTFVQPQYSGRGVMLQAPRPQGVQQSTDLRIGSSGNGREQSGGKGESPFHPGYYFENRLLTFALNVKNGKEEVKKVIDVFCSVADVKCEYDEENKFLKVIPYEVEFFNFPNFFNYQISHDLTAISSKGGSSAEGSGVSGSGAFSISESYTDFVKNIFSGLRSIEGRVFVSKRGYVVVVDRPSYIKRMEKVWREEMKKQRPVFLNVKVVRVDLNKEFQSGIDWDVLLQNFLGPDRVFKFSGDFAFTGEGISFSLDTSRFDYFLKLLSRYGNVKVVYDWLVKSRGGIPVVFSDIQSIPYLTQTVVQGDSGTTTATEPQYVDVGLKITVLGTLEKERAGKEKYEGQVYINISSLVSIDNLGTESNPVYVPNVKSSVVTIPFDLNLGETMVISSFKVQRKEVNSKGFPVLSKLPILNYLFGYNEKNEGTSEIVVIITPEKPIFEKSFAGTENDSVFIYEKGTEKKGK